MKRFFAIDGVNKRNSLTSAAFTLAELLVVFGIISVVMAVVLTGQNNFNKTLVLSNTAYDVALTLQSAKTYGIGSRTVSGGITNAGYGIHFDKDSPRTLTLFTDIYPLAGMAGTCHAVADATAPNARPGDCRYDPLSGEKVLEYTLGNSITISDMCAYHADASESCVFAHGGGLKQLDIIFTRPNADPFMSIDNAYSATTPVVRACITLTSPQGGARFVEVNAAGSITANAASCP